MSASVLNPAGSTRIPPIAPMSTPRSRQSVEQALQIGMPGDDHPGALRGIARRHHVGATLEEAVDAARRQPLGVRVQAVDADLEQQVDPGAGGEDPGQVRQSELVAAGVGHDRRHRVRRPLAERCVEAEVADIECRRVREQLGAQVQEPDPRRAQEPLHRGRHQRVHAVARDVDRHDAGGLGGIHQQHRPVRVGGIGDRAQIVPAAGERGDVGDADRDGVGVDPLAPAPPPRHRRRRWARTAPPGRRGRTRGRRSTGRCRRR